MAFLIHSVFIHLLGYHTPLIPSRGRAFPAMMIAGLLLVSSLSFQSGPRSRPSLAQEAHTMV